MSEFFQTSRITANYRNWLRLKEPAEVLDYTEDATDFVIDPVTGYVDPITNVSLAVKPSGDGELLVTNLFLDITGKLITMWLSKGVPGRIYILDLQFETEAQRVFQRPLHLRVNSLYAEWTPPAPESTDFGPRITTYFVPTLTDVVQTSDALFSFIS